MASVEEVPDVPVAAPVVQQARMFIRDRCIANGRWWGLLFDALPHVSIQKHVGVE